MRTGFDLATTKGQKNEGHTLRFASAKFFSFNPFAKRNPMDDIESLVYSMWHISGVPLGKWTWLFGTGIPEGFLLSRCNKVEAAARVMVSRTFISYILQFRIHHRIFRKN